MIVSSTEPREFHRLGALSTLPEKYGVDFLWRGEGKGGPGWCGVQRKEVRDLVASIRDSRLARESKQMRGLHHCLLIVEGKVDYIGKDVVAGRTRIPVALWDSAIWSMQATGVMFAATAGKWQTIEVINRFHQWTKKTRHGVLDNTREKMKAWGEAGSRDFGVHLLTGLPGVGAQTAERVYDHFGGVPWAWTVTEEELCQVPGIGPTKAKRMLAILTKENNHAD